MITTVTRRHAWSTLALIGCLAASANANSGPDSLEWFHGPLANAMSKAKGESRPMLIYFWKDGSEMCGKLYTESLASKQGAEQLSSYVCYSAKLQDEAGAELFTKFNVRTMPTVLMFDDQGKLDDGIIGYIDTKGFFAEVDRIKNGKDTIGNYRSRVAATPDDIASTYQLALKLQDLGDSEAHDALIEDISERDPDGDSATGADVLWRKTVKAVLKSTQAPKEADLSPVYGFLKKCKHDEVLFLGWDWVSQMEYSRGDRSAMRKAVAQAWSHIPEDKIIDWGSETAGKAWKMRDELSKTERKLVLSIAERVVKSVEKLVEDKGIGDDEKGEKWRSFIASNYDNLACAQHMNGKKGPALTSIARAMKLAPTNEKYKKRLASFKKK